MEKLKKLKLLCKPMKQGRGHRSLGCIAKPSNAWHGRAQPGACFGALSCTCKSSRSGRECSAHADGLRHRCVQQKHPRNDKNIKKPWFPVTAAERSLAVRPQTSWRHFPPSSYLTQDLGQAPSSAGLQRVYHKTIHISDSRLHIDLSLY